MASVQSISLPEQQANPDAFPVGFGPESTMSLDETLQWIRDNRSTLLQQVADHGAVLLRGFPHRVRQ